MEPFTGVVTVRSTDPFTRLIYPLLNLSADDPTAVGICLNDVVHLRNIYDTHPSYAYHIPVQLSTLSSLGHTDWIRLYPISSNTPLLSRATISSISSKTRSSSITEKFSEIATRSLTIEDTRLYPKEIIYTDLLLQYCELSNLPHSHNTTNTNGYTIINSILSQLMDMSSLSYSRSSSIIPCPYLGTPLRFPTTPTQFSSSIDMSHDLQYLSSAFTSLYINNSEFRSTILCKTSTTANPESLDILFNQEKQLIDTIVHGLQGGIISNTTLNEQITKLGHSRRDLGYYERLSISSEPKEYVSVVTDHVQCTFNMSDHGDSSSSTALNALNELGSYIGHIIDRFDDPDALTINIGTLMEIYNRAVSGTTIPSIVPPHVGTKSTLSRQVVLVLPGDNGTEITNIPISSKAINIAMYNADLTQLTATQLLDILVYIDSLRDSDGSTDTRYVNLQNEITHELALRNRKSVSKR
jgi:hypothetical protein